MLRRFSTWLHDYTDNSDPMARPANKIALVVASNLPFYPLYLHWIVGQSAWPAWLTMLTIPGFAAVPAVARRHSLMGRALLPVVGVVNTVLCAKAIGVPTGVELFLLPCVLLSVILFRPSERIVTLPVLALPYASYLFLDAHLGAPLRVYSEAGYAAMIALNAVSVASLMALIGYLYATAVAERLR